MLRVELTTQLMRIRTLIALACLAAVPVASGAGTASHAGHRYNGQSGLFGASPFSAMNHMMASLEFTQTLLLPLIVALLAAAIASADRDWGILRYLYVAPVSRSRLLASKLTAVAAVTAITLGCVLLAGLAIGLPLFGWHPFHLIGAPALGAGTALGRIAIAGGYTLLCMLSIAAIAFALGVWLPRGAEALGAAVGFVIVALIVNGQAALHAVAVILPVHYWQDWTAMFTPGAHASLIEGAAAQAGAIAVAVSCAALVLRRRDPAA